MMMNMMIMMMIMMIMMMIMMMMVMMMMIMMMVMMMMRMMMMMDQFKKKNVMVSRTPHLSWTPRTSPSGSNPRGYRSQAKTLVENMGS